MNTYEGEVSTCLEGDATVDENICGNENLKNDNEGYVPCQSYDLQNIGADFSSHSVFVDDEIPCSSTQSLTVISDTPESSKLESCKQSVRGSGKRDIVRRRLFTKEKDKKCTAGIKRPQRQEGKPEDNSVSPKRKRRRKKPLESEEAEELLENMEGEIDKVLEETAEKNKLTAANVKNILWHVITNQHVLSMVRNTMISDGNCDLSEIEEAEYQPKLTRAKVKEMKEKQSDLPWPVTPVKEPPLAPSTQLLAKEFANDESSSDEEYHPANDEESEDEDDSVVSPPASDMSSPDIRLPEPFTPPQTDLQELQPLSPIPVNVTDKELDDGIALRTRSKLPLNDMPLEMIEASFIPPDFTMDMYDSDCGDEDWKNFLTDFCKPLETLETTPEPQDDLNDPEYNFLEDEDDVLDSWDLRYDRAVKITKKEWNELIAGLLEAGEHGVNIGGDEEDDETAAPNVLQESSAVPAIPEEALPSPSTISTASPNVNSTSSILSLSEHEKMQLAQHMRMHVQLLTQTYILARHATKFKACALGAKALLFELKNFGLRQQSAFHSDNLDDALQLVTKLETGNKDVKMAMCEPRPARVGVNIIKEDKLTMYQSKVFIYPELLPLRGPKLDMCGKEKVRFTPAEDQLIAMGLEQFTPIKDFSTAKLIKSLLIPIKTEQQIQIRIKNVKSNSKIPESNPIKFYKKYRVAPPIQTVIKPFSPENMCPPADLPRNVLPGWMATLVANSKKSTLKYHPIVSLLPKLASAPPKLTKVKTRAKRLIPKRQPAKLILPQPIISHLQLPRTPTKHLSPLKQISPILKKYHKGMRVPTKVSFGASTSLILQPAEREKIWKPVLPRPEPPAESEIAPAPLPVSNAADKPSVGMTTRKKVKDSATETTNNMTTEIPEKTQDNPSSQVANVNLDCNVITNVASSNKMHAEQSASEKDCIHGVGDGVLEVPAECEAPNETDVCEDGDVDGEGEGDNEGDLAALMAASTTICKKNPLIKKKNKQKRDVESLLNLIAEDLVQVDPLKDDREAAFAEMYLVRVKEALANDEETYKTFLQTLCEFEKSGKTVVQLYDDVSKVLSGYPELVEDFVIFLLPEQAKECGRLTDYLLFQKMRVFLRKIEVHFSKQPQHIQKILRALNQIHKQSNVTLSTVRATFLPLLRGQPHLLEEFLQLLPQEQPPESWMTEFEEITIPDSDDEHSDDGFETFAIPETPDIYGTNICPCTCHQETSDPRFQNRVRHCVRCGIKFVGGKVYLQTGRRTLKPAQIIYKDKEQLDPNPNSCIQTSAQASSSSVSKENDHNWTCVSSAYVNNVDDVERTILRPTKDCSHVCKSCGESLKAVGTGEDQGKTCDNCDMCNYPKSCVELLNKFTKSKLKVKEPIQFSVIDSTDHKEKLDTCRSKLMPAESVSSSSNLEECLKSSAENKVSCSEDVAPSIADTSPFSRDEDRILLQTCQQKGATTEAFQDVSKLLRNRTVDQIKERFVLLMKIIEEKSEPSEDESDH